MPGRFSCGPGRLDGLGAAGDGPSAGSLFGSVLLPILPRQVEVHAGFAPGSMCGLRSLPPYDGGFYAARRFSCTSDAGLRLIIPVRRFRVFGDFRCHCYRTGNFRLEAGRYRPARSCTGLGVGVSFDF